MHAHTNTCSSRLRALNDQLMLLERVFILPRGLPDRPGVRHALFTPSKFNSYGKKKCLTELGLCTNFSAKRADEL